MPLKNIYRASNYSMNIKIFVFRTIYGAKMQMKTGYLDG